MKTHTHTHTPGPWKLNFPLITAQGSMALTVAVVLSREDSNARTDSAAKTKAEAIANAQLIAAAPELLAALREIESKLTALLCERVLDSTLPEFYEVRDARNSARAAISKAEGVK